MPQELNKVFYPDPVANEYYHGSSKYPAYFDANNDGIFAKDEKFVYGGFQKYEEDEDGNKTYIYEKQLQAAKDTAIANLGNFYSVNDLKRHQIELCNNEKAKFVELIGNVLSFSECGYICIIFFLDVW